MCEGFPYLLSGTFCSPLSPPSPPPPAVTPSRVPGMTAGEDNYAVSFLRLFLLGVSSGSPKLSVVWPNLSPNLMSFPPVAIIASSIVCEANVPPSLPSPFLASKPFLISRATRR